MFPNHLCHTTHYTIYNPLQYNICNSRSPASPSWHDDDRITSPAIAAHNSMGGGQSQQQKCSYLDASDTRSLSTDTTTETAITGTTVAHPSVVGKMPSYGGGNQPYAMHPGNSSSNDTASLMQQSMDDRKSIVINVDDQDGQIELTETKSISSNKSGGSIPETR